MGKSVICLSNKNSFDETDDIYTTPKRKNIPKISGLSSPSGLCRTPGYGVHSRYTQVSPDSGFELTPSPSPHDKEFKPSSVKSKLTRISEEIKTPIAELRRKWRERQPLSNPKVSHDRLALCILIIIASSTIFALCILHHGLNKGNRNNLKYGSIEYGFHQRHQRRQDPLSVTDEKGNALGGKKAAIQFAHDLKKMKNDDQDIINRLSLKLSNNIKKVVSNNNAKPVQPLDVENIKKVQL